VTDFASIGPTGITKAEHDELVAKRGGRPLTQGPIKRRTTALPDELSGLSVVDQVRAQARRNRSGNATEVRADK
jgi:hypothetical protein